MGNGLETFPFHRLQWLERHLGIPLAAAAQCQLVSDAAAILAPVGEQLLQQAAQGRLLTALLQNPRELAQAPSRWMPWNYRENPSQEPVWLLERRVSWGYARLPKAHSGTGNSS